ncbi:PTS beta-glucoside transporter subunit EIIBCA [Vagococcus martis]|uniref:PTS beta-glucoside transporter subunit EIIBCA n=1 Tax=Vagococcus martis TaxID=1768210 RepID=A0A1V4DJB3_9ENTE|nr:beta-glucoside-specific PTS transporter subunit IIABC [Vagococcus martis]OPF88654.1 PTS beta-glucoside transporter subunit EIIBCA [Vagococcus martis]
MSKVRDYSKLAQDIVEILGKDNILNATRCATRLRLVLKDIPTDAKEKISTLPGVISVVINNGQFQIVIGPHVGEVYDAFTELVNVDTTEEEPKGSILNRIIATMSAVFAPFVYILAAAGILQGALILINLAYPAFATTDTYRVFSFISWAPFTFLPIFIAITASKHFKVNTYIAVAISMALVSPDWTTMAGEIASGKHLTFLNIPLSETVYTSSVLPPLIMVWLLSYLEKFVEKRLPGVVKPLLTPLICMVIMVPVTILVFGPASAFLANGIANGYNSLVQVAPPLAGALIGGFWQVVVIFGVHWGITPVVMANFDMYGRDSFQAFQTIAVVAQVGAVLGVFLKTRNKELKGVSLSAFITGLFGITEPAIYGVTLRFKKPFIFGCISGAIGAIVASFFNPYYFAYAGLPSLLTVVNGINSEFPTSFIGIVIGCLIALVGSAALVMIFGFGETNETDKELSEDIEGKVKKETLVNYDMPTPIIGEVMALTDVPDEVFASGAMGSGVAVKPTDNKVYAPFDGVVTMVIDSKHAIGLTSDTGIELLIHVGLDTVKLEGKPFKCHIVQGQSVKKGDLLLEFNAEEIEEAGYSLITPVIITNSFEFKSIQTEENNIVNVNDSLLKFN